MEEISKNYERFCSYPETKMLVLAPKTFHLIFSRRFMKWNVTIIVAFFQSTRTDRNSSTKFYEILYQARLKGFSFFRHCETFLLKRVPLQFCFMFRDRMDIEKSQRAPFLARQFRSNFRVFQVLDALKSFSYFWALDMAPTYAVPSLFLYYFLPIATRCWWKPKNYFLLDLRL